VLEERGRAAGLGPQTWNLAAPDWQGAERELMQDVDALIQADVANPQWVRAAWSDLVDQRFKGEEADAVLAVSDAMVDSRIQSVIEMANALKLPTMLYDPGAVAKGGLATYSADYTEVGRLSAKYVQRILQGADPADFAVEGADKLSLVINLKTARQLGIKIPEAVLTRADRIIE